MRIFIFLAIVGLPLLGRAESASTQKADAASSDGKYILSDVHVTIEGDATPPPASKTKDSTSKDTKKKAKKKAAKSEPRDMRD